MTNNQANFIPFSSGVSEEQTFNAIQNSNKEPSDSSDFVDSTIGSKPFPSKVALELLGEEMPTPEISVPSQPPAYFPDDEFDKILSRVTGEADSNQEQTPAIDSPSLSDLGIESMLLGDDGDLSEFSDESEISEEDKEAIYAEGFMAGSIEQKENFDKRTLDLQQTVLSIKQIESTPINLSDEINQSVGAFARSLMESIIGEIEDKHLNKLVEGKLAEFVDHVKGWGSQIVVYCSPQDYVNFCEIFDVEPSSPHISASKYKYVQDKDMASGKYRLELTKEDQTITEAIMDVKQHLDGIRESVSELL